MNWKRYLDDCFIIWSKEESNFNIVYNILDTLDSDIKFTMEKRSSEIPFLNVLVRINNNQLVEDGIKIASAPNREELINP